MLSQTAEYALRAVLYLAEHGERGPVPVGTLARALELPPNYLAKTLHALARTGALASTRGKRGGFQLAVPASRLSLLSVVAPFDQLDERRRCLLGRKECTDTRACAAHARWKRTAAQVATFFRETTVEDLRGGAGSRAAKRTPPRRHR